MGLTFSTIHDDPEMHPRHMVDVVQVAGKQYELVKIDSHTDKLIQSHLNGRQISGFDTKYTQHDIESPEGLYRRVDTGIAYNVTKSMHHVDRAVTDSQSRPSFT
jgi:hypothetical protein